MIIEYLPPFELRQVTVDGYLVPMLEARESDHGLECHISLDARFGAVIPADIADQVIWLIANALAIGAGYSCHGEHSQPINPYRLQVRCIETVSRTDSGGHHERS